MYATQPEDQRVNYPMSSSVSLWVFITLLGIVWGCDEGPVTERPSSLAGVTGAPQAGMGEPSLAGVEPPYMTGGASAGGVSAPLGGETPTMGGEPSGGAEPEERFTPGGRVWARLTRLQYAQSVEDALFVDLETLGLELEPDTNPYLFNSIGATSDTISALGVEQYVEAAYELAEAYLERRSLIEMELGCAPTQLRDGCTDQWLRTLGLRLYRRPLTDEELARWLSLGELAQGGAAGWEVGAQAIVAGLLQSPWTLYRLEVGEPHPSRPELSRYTSLELASRLSFVLLNSAPDVTLLNHGLEGTLNDEQTLESELDRLIALPRARESVMEFFLQFLDIPRLRRVSRDPQRYPGFSSALLEAMEMEVRLLVDDLAFRRDADIRLLLSEPRAFVNSTLAAHYDLPTEGTSPVLFEPVALDPNGPRAGLLGLGAFLTMNAHPTDTSPTLRGKYIRERLLCQEVPPPPGDIDLNLEADQSETRTLRERLEQHREDPACFGCHSFIDPPGFLFERFDAVGRYREEVDGVVLDASGDLDGVPMEDSAALGRHLAQGERVTRCLTRQVYRFALGRLEQPSEEPELDRLHESWRAQGFRFKALLKLLLMSEGFRSFDPRAQVTAVEGSSE